MSNELPPDNVPPIGEAEKPAPAVQASLSTTLNARLAPQDVEAERSVLGGILLTNESLYDVLDIVRTEDFYREPHRQIYGAMQELVVRNEPIDVITVADELKRQGQLESAGGPIYLASLDASVPATANLKRYAEIVRDKALERRVIAAAHSIARDGYDQKGTTREFADSAEAAIFAATEGARLGGGQGPRDLAPLVRGVFQNFERLYERQSDVTGLATGFSIFDGLTAGLQPGDLIILAARPSMGKTALAVQMACNVAIESKLPALIFSLEMGAEALTTRMFSSEARVDGQRLRTGKLLDADWPKLARAADRLFRAPIVIDDGSALSVLDIRARARRVKARNPALSLIVVDYLQLMKGTTKTDNREQEVAEISRGLKAIAKELNVPVIALSQLNRSLERREDKRPQLSDLRESGAIEQDADLICFIYRDEVYNKESADKGVAEIIIGKQRNGPTGTVRVSFQRDFTRFENLAALPDETAQGNLV